MEAEQLLGSRREARRFARVVKLLLAFMFVAIGLDYVLSRSNDPDVRRAQEKRGVRVPTLLPSLLGGIYGPVKDASHYFSN